MRPTTMKAAAVCVVAAASAVSAQMSQTVRRQRPSPALAVPAPCLAIAGVANSPESSLVINRNAEGAFPLCVFAGEVDPNIFVVEGAPGAYYSVNLTSCGSVTTAYAVRFAHGYLDESGVAEIMLPPGELKQGDVFALRASVEDASAESGWRVSGASQVRVVRTMASDLDLNMPVGSRVRIRAPATAVNAASVSVGNIEFGVIAKTEFSNFDALPELSVGDWLVVQAEFNGAGGFNAMEIGLEDAEPDARLRGRVQGVGPAGVAMLNVSVFTSSATTYFDMATGLWTDYAAIEPGMNIEVVIPAAVPFPSATQVLLNFPTEPEPEPEPKPEDEDENENENPLPPFCS